MLKLAVTDVKGRGEKKLILFNSKRMQRERRRKKTVKN